jgi:riboflavin transporter FmnP
LPLLLGGGAFLIQIISKQEHMKKENATLSKVSHTRTLVSIAMMGAVSYVLAFMEMPVPLSPAFAKMDLSDFPALIAAFAFSPFAGLMVELIKNGLQLISTNTAGVGELANFLMGGAFVFTAGAIYKRHKTKYIALIACIAGSVAMGVAAAILNYFVLLPLYEQFMPLDQVIAAFGAFIPFIKTKFDVCLYNALPFTFLKGLVISLFTLIIYKRLSPILKGIK